MFLVRQEDQLALTVGFIPFPTILTPPVTRHAGALHVVLSDHAKDVLLLLLAWSGVDMHDMPATKDVTNLSTHLVLQLGLKNASSVGAGVCQAVYC